MVARMRLAAAAMLAALAWAVGAAASAPMPLPKNAAFAIWREGSRIGTMRIDYRRDGDTLVAETRLDVEVKILFVVAYRYAQRRTEIFRGNDLLSYRVETDDNGTKKAAAARLDGDTIRTDGPRGTASARADALPASFWHPASVRREHLIDVDTCAPLSVAVADEGEETIEAAGGQVRARRWTVRGDLERTVWYAVDDGEWLKMSFAARDGSTIVYQRLP
jgi:hypothetical protein